MCGTAPRRLSQTCTCQPNLPLLPTFLPGEVQDEIAGHGRRNCSKVGKGLPAHHSDAHLCRHDRSSNVPRQAAVESSVLNNAAEGYPRELQPGRYGQSDGGAGRNRCLPHPSLVNSSWDHEGVWAGGIPGAARQRGFCPRPLRHTALSRLGMHSHDEVELDRAWGRHRIRAGIKESSSALYFGDLDVLQFRASVGHRTFTSHSLCQGKIHLVPCSRNSDDTGRTELLFSRFASTDDTSVPDPSEL